MPKQNETGLLKGRRSLSLQGLSWVILYVCHVDTETACKLHFVVTLTEVN